MSTTASRSAPALRMRLSSWRWRTRAAASRPRTSAGSSTGSPASTRIETARLVGSAWAWRSCRRSRRPTAARFGSRAGRQRLGVRGARADSHRPARAEAGRAGRRGIPKRQPPGTLNDASQTPVSSGTDPACRCHRHDRQASSTVSMRSIVMLGAAVLLLTLSARPAEAHAVLVASEPAAGQRLATAPALVVLRFTEPLNGRLSRATVTDPDGQQFQGGAWGAAELRVRLLTNAPGVYRVAWATVSVVDGHTLRGGFAFGVGVPVGGGGQPGGQADGGAGAGPGLRDVVVAAGRAVEDAALLVAVGMLLLVGLVRLDPRLPRVRPRLCVTLAIALAAGLAVVVAEAAAAAATTAVHGLSAQGMAGYLTAGPAGWARLSRVALEALALLLWLLWRSARGRLRVWRWPAVV